MRSMIYLLIMTVKNYILELKRKPALLIIYILFIALILFGIIASALSGNQSERTEYVDIGYLKAALFALGVFFMGIGIYNGLSHGSSFFGMSDVNFLFTAPVNPKKILIYGLLKQAGTALLSTLFMFGQYANLKSLFNFSFFDTTIVIVGFVVLALFSQILPIPIYMLTNGNKRRKNIVKAVAILCIAPAVCLFLYNAAIGKSIGDAIIDMTENSFFNYTPIVGWILQCAISIVSGDTVKAIPFAVLTFFIFIIAIALVAFSKADFYEDVLSATEKNHEKQTAVKEGNLNATSINKKIKVTSTGISGNGASALFGKHMREAFRSSTLKILDGFSLFYMSIGGLMAFFMKDINGNIAIIAVLAISMYMMSLTIGTGKGLKDLYSPYIYLIPENAFAKVVWSNAETVLRIFVESVLMYVVFAIFAGGNPLILIICVITRVSYSLVLIGINILSLRFLKDTLNVVTTLIVYLFASVLFLIPGIIACVVIAVILGGDIGIILGLLSLAVWEILLGGLFLFLGRGILHDCDIATMLKK